MINNIIKVLKFFYTEFTILLLAMNSYVLSSVVPKAFKNRNPGLKSLHKFIYARVRIKTFDGCCKREWEWSGPLDLFTNNAPPPHSVECFDSGRSINELVESMFCFWPGHNWLGLAIDSLNFDEKNIETWNLHSKCPNGENTKIDSACSKSYHRIPMQSPILSHEFIANSKMPVLPSRLK